MLQRDEREEIIETDQSILSIIKSLGGSQAKYRRERKRAVRAMVSEVYSPPRVTAATKLLPELKLLPGFALDLTTNDYDGRAWDFDDKEMRDRALKRVRDEKPLLLVGSPMCTAFSVWQRTNNLIRWLVTVVAELKRAIEHLKFCVELYRIQHEAGWYFVHERMRRRGRPR